jgi:phytoene desaturase
VTSLVTTPIDFKERLLSYKGAAFSLEPVLWQSAWLRPHNKSEEVEHLYFVGAGTHPGAGVPRCHLHRPRTRRGGARCSVFAN